MTDAASNAPREQDLEHAMRELVRVSDAVAAGLLKGLVEMQADVIRRLQELEAQVTDLESRSARQVQGGTRTRTK